MSAKLTSIIYKLILINNLKMEAFLSQLLEEERGRFPDGESPWKFAYGTAGFRDK